MLVAKLGITAQLKPKYNLRPTAAEVGDAVASGIVELGIAPVSEILGDFKHCGHTRGIIVGAVMNLAGFVGPRQR